MRTPESAIVTGIGIVSAIGQGRAAFLDSLLAGRHRFAVMRRPGRQWSAAGGETPASAFAGAEIDDLTMPESIPHGLLRTASLSARSALVALDEAWSDAALDELEPGRIGLVIGGSNVQQRELTVLQDAYRERMAYLRPTYAMSFMDTDLCGLCTASFAIRGFARTVGAASASGQMAVIEAVEAVASGRVDACIAIGALMDLSYWECQGFSAIGAMAPGADVLPPALACRPFDAGHRGFVYGEACAALVIEREGARRRVGAAPYARIAGWHVALDGNRNPDPSLDGEVAAIRGALAHASLEAGEIDYVNPHGTGSARGDAVELQALRACGLDHAWLNATKSVVGHGLSAAGAVELAAVLLQMRAGRLHPTRNLEQPIEPDFRWVREAPVAHAIRHAINLSIGFGGVNTALCVSRHEAAADAFQESRG
ncbi:polyketide beta-ketoacyl:ACP synthase [Burkholderia sp. JSH-S8]|nr:polyketide beta-ketoacyl:ACP synthase [Burkholderia sp. JSH-S8]